LNWNALTLSSTFASFRYRNYRLWFFGQLISLTGSWMQRAAQGYLVFTLTHSSAFLGYVAFASGLPSLLFMLYGGVVADRVSLRKLILITETCMMVLAFILAGLVFTGAVQPWHILVLSFLLGTATAFETPARQSLVVDLVDRQDMTNAIALNVTLFNLGMIVGPATAGVVYALAGPAWCFTLNGISFLAVIAALALMTIQPRPAPVRHASVLSAIAEGIHYVRSQPVVRTLTISAFFYNIYDYAMIVFIPAFAVQLLNGDATTNGLLLTANAGGAVLGGLGLAAFANRAGRGRIWSISAYITPLMIAAFAFSRSLPFSLLLTVVIGVTSITVLNNSNALIQSTVSDDLRGRVMSLYALLMMSGGPFGSMLLGVIADRTGITVVVLLCAGMALLFAAWVRLRARQISAMK
jgi:predicted MFS family arabinose efflux permease